MSDFFSSDVSDDSDEEKIKVVKLMAFDRTVWKCVFWGSNFENVFFKRAILKEPDEEQFFI